MKKMNDRTKTSIHFTAATFFVVLILLIVGACAKKAPPPPDRPKGYPKPYKVGKNWYQPIPHARDFRQQGKASWYGKKFHGRKTSSGETYDMYAMTAAHKTLPFNTQVRIRNLDNGKMTEVRINDRGPFVRGRIIDLTYSAAKKIGMIGPGTARVEIFALGTATEEISGGKKVKTYVQQDYYSGNFTFQVGAFKDKNNADRLKRELDKKYKFAHVVPFQYDDETFYRVRVGRCSTLDQASEYEAILIQDGYPDAFIIAE